MQLGTARGETVSLIAAFSNFLAISTDDPNPTRYPHKPQPVSNNLLLGLNYRRVSGVESDRVGLQPRESIICKTIIQRGIYQH